jgi:phosphoheptose isomerase
MGRVALISEHASPLAMLGGVDAGGQNVYVDQIARHLSARGWLVDVLTRRDAEDLPEVVPLADGGRVVHIDAGPPEPLPKEQLLPFMPRFAENVLAFCRRERRPYDLMHANFFMSGLVAAEVKRTLGTPFVITFHALGKVRRLHQGTADGFPDARFGIEERVAREADRIIAECPQDEDDLVRLYGADPAKVRIVPCGFDHDELWPVPKAEARERLGLDRDERVVLQLGRMVPRKGVEDVIRGFGKLAERGVDAHLLVVGGETPDPDPVATPEIGRLMRVAERIRVEDRVTFTGSRERETLRDYYSSADVFVTMPWYEPFGITPVEAMACGTPVVGSEVGGVKYSVVDGETGYLVPARDADALADALERLLTDEPLRQLLARQCIRRANRLFTWSGVADEIGSLYEDVLAEYGTAGAPGPGLATVDSAWSDSVETLRRSQELLRGYVAEAGERLTECFARGGKVLVAGNGGSASDAQHFAGELVGRFLDHEREGLPVIALNTDGAVLTAWSNDVGFDDVFARQVRALGRRGDILVGISTSGASPNLLRAFECAKAAGVETIAVLGRDGGRMRQLADLAITVPSQATPRIQEVHTLVLHLLCALVEEQLRSSRTTHITAEAAEPQRANA